ncbi:UNVERIFIED_ORG: phage gpG-like protein [Arthrobacter sp. UYEF1]
MELRFEIEGEPQLVGYLGVVAEGIKDFGKPLQSIGSELIKTFDLNFAQRGGVFGGWAPRKPQYRAGNRVDTWPLLEKTGDMRHSFRSDASTTSVSVGNAAPYFAYHQSNQPRARLPRRVMMKVDAARRTFIVKAFQLHIVEALRGRR